MRARLGLERHGPDPAILFAGDARSGFEAAAPVIDRLGSETHRLAVVLTSGDADLRAWLADRFAETRIVAMPLDVPWIAELWLSRGRVRTVVALDGAFPLTRRFAAALSRRATPLAQLGAMRDDIPVRPDLVVPAENLAGAEQIIQQLLVLVGRERPWETRTDQRLVRAIGNLLFDAVERPRGRGWLSGLVERLDTAESLRARLGGPRTILCVGNGPSSEDPRITSVAHDALFRVNHSWQSRSHLTDPDVVFTGERSTMRRIRRAVFGVRGVSAEKSLLAIRALKPFKGKLVYFVADRFADLPPLDRRDGMRPTNGAIMVAVAVGLAPDRLVIAGIDLFRHPDGTYPGGSEIPNAYTPAHSHDVDLAVILSALDRYDGELMILSEVLQAEWDAHRKDFPPG